MTAVQPPELSAILVVDRTETGADVIELLRAEAGDVALELVLVGLDGATSRNPGQSDSFASVITTSIPGGSLSDARADGIRAATAGLVVITETHSFPRPGWARGLVERFEGGWAAVAPRIETGNRDRRGRALTAFDYGPFMGGAAGERAVLPGHNTAYRREDILAALEGHPAGMDAEGVLQQQIRAAGGRLYFDPSISTRHCNFETYLPAIREWWCFARVYAAQRTADWGPLRRLAYAAGWPLVPPLRVARILADARRHGRLGIALRGLDILAICATVASIAEALGYLTGRSNPEGTRELELHRMHLAPSVPRGADGRVS